MVIRRAPYPSWLYVFWGQAISGAMLTIAVVKSLTTLELF